MSAVDVLEPRHSGVADRLGELWHYRRLIPWFGKRFLEKRYVRTWLGWTWIPLRPVLDTFARVLVFGAILSVPSGDVPYLLFFLVGMSAWALFEESLYWATRSLEVSRRVLRRVYVPRLTTLVGSLAVGLVDYLVYLILIGLTVAYFAVSDGTAYLVIDAGLLIAAAGLLLGMLLAQSFGLWLSVLGAQARDVRFGLRYATGFWFFLTPVVYPLDAIPSGLRWLAAVNPVTAPVEMVKHGLLGVGSVPLDALLVTFAWIAVVAGLGFSFFARSEAAALDAL